MKIISLEEHYRLPAIDQMPIKHADKEKIAHLNAERLFMNLGKSDGS